MKFKLQWKKENVTPYIHIIGLKVSITKVYILSKSRGEEYHTESNGTTRGLQNWWVYDTSRRILPSLSFAKNPAMLP